MELFNLELPNEVN